MKLCLILVALVPLLFELTMAAPSTSLDPYGRVNRNSRMSRNNYGQEDEDDDQDDEDEENDDEQDDDVYPPDFSKLFPNPDGRPVGPESGPSSNSYGHNHPVSPQQGRPSHGPASIRGPAALRGPIQAQHGQRQGGIGHGRPQHDGPPPSYGPPRRGRPPQYRHDVDFNEIEETVPEGRQMSYGKRRVVGYPIRRVHYGGYPMTQNRHVFNGFPRYPVYPQYTNRIYRPRYTPVMYGRSEMESDEEDVPGPVQLRAHSARVYNPWSHSPLRADAYNPQFVFNPTEMRLRRRFRYHPTQRIPSQRIPIYGGQWGNPRNTYFHAQTGAPYGSPNYYGTQF